MDFSYLLELAKGNEDKNKADGSLTYSTKVSSARKLCKPGPKVDAIKKIIEKQFEEKQQQKKEFLEKRTNLLALRAQDKKSIKRVHAMINRTKGASKAVLEDAKDLITAKGEEQCDEDDYGYESTISQQIFNDLRNKYSEIPEDERIKFNKTAKKNINDIKTRVLNCLKQEEEEELGMRKKVRKKRKEKEDDDNFINDGDAYDTFDKEKEKKGKSWEEEDKKNKKIPVNLNITNYKSNKYENFKYEPKDKKDEKKKQKNSSNFMSFSDLLKVAQKKQEEPSQMENPLETFLKMREEKRKALENSRPLTAKEKKEIEEEHMRNLRRKGLLPPADTRKVTSHDQQSITKATHCEINPLRKQSSMKDSAKKAKDFVPPSLKNRRDPIPTQKQPLPSSQGVKYVAKEPFSPPSRSSSKPSSVPHKKGRIFSDEEERDSEMDDFIDDGDDGVDYSNEISKMFNYDRNKYRYNDEDDEVMEASFSQMQKEESKSSKIGLMEDLEDLAREEERKKRKKLLKGR